MKALKKIIECDHCNIRVVVGQYENCCPSCGRSDSKVKISYE